MRKCGKIRIIDAWETELRFETRQNLIFKDVPGTSPSLFTNKLLGKCGIWHPGEKGLLLLVKVEPESQQSERCKALIYQRHS